MTESTSRSISTGRVVWALSLGAAVFVTLDLLALAFTMATGHDHVMGLLPLFDLDKERGVAMLFQATLFLANAGLLAVVAAARGKEDGRVWIVLAYLFTFLAVDEFVSIHETLMNPVQRLLGGDVPAFLHFAWIVPYGLGVAALGLWVLPRLLRLPPRPRKALFGSAVVYVTGAMVFEAIGGWWLVRIGGEAARPDLVYELLTTIEETGEMAGLILLTYALLELLRRAHPVVDLRFVE